MSNIFTNIILDMDGTLLDSIPPFCEGNPTLYEEPVARQCLDDFMKFVFETFERVSIWTAGSKEWYEKCYEKILKHYIPEGKTFYFVKTRDHYQFLKTIKPLEMIYAEYPEHYNSSNTLIVDDNPITYSKNKENAIPIKSFYYNNLPLEIREKLNKEDFELLSTICLINQKINGEQINLFNFDNTITIIQGEYKPVNSELIQDDYDDLYI